MKPGHGPSRRHRGHLQPRDRRARRAEACHLGSDHAGVQRHASGASGLDRIVGVMSASGSHDSLRSNRCRGATMGPSGCSAQSSPVVFRARCCTCLQGLSPSWDDWRGQKVFLIRKRSQVRVLDRPLAGIQEFAAFAQLTGIWVACRLGEFGCSMGPHGAISITGVRGSARGFTSRSGRCGPGGHHPVTCPARGAGGVERHAGW